MSVDAAFVQADADLLAQVGRAATYTPPGGVSVVTLASVQRLTRPSADGMTMERLTLAYLPVADVPEPRVGAVLSVGATAYRVEALDDDDGAVVSVRVKVIP